MKQTYILPMLIIFAFSIVGCNAQDKQPELLAAQHSEADLIVVSMYSAYCGKSTELSQKLQDIQKEFKGKGVLFTTFNFSCEYNKGQTKMHSSLIGLEELFKEHEDKTGYIVLVNPKTKKVVGTITHDKSSEVIKHAISAAL